MKFKSFLKIYFIHVLSLDYYIYKKNRLFFFENYFFNNTFRLIVNSKKLENNLISELKLLLILEQLCQFRVINNKFIFIFLDNLFVFYYKMYFYKFIYLRMFNYFQFSRFFLQNSNFLLEMFLFNFKISFQDFNKMSFLLELKKN